MIRYIVGKTVFTLAVLLGVSFITFLLTFVVPSDPARALAGIQADESTLSALRKELGLDKSFYVQYLCFLKRALRLDIGRSYVTNREVTSLIAERFQVTAKLALFAVTLAVITGLSLGILSAYLKNDFFEKSIISTSVFFASIPVFFLALILSLLFGSILSLLPISGYASGFEGIKYMILPSVALAVYPGALIARLIAVNLDGIMHTDYVRAHFAMGHRRFRIVVTYALKNAMVSVLTVVGNSMATLLTGAFFVEYIFSLPGIGLLWVDSILRYDFPVIIGVVMFSACVFVIISMIVDLVYPLVDARMKRADVFR